MAHKILVVDDDPAIVHMLRDLLVSEGYAVLIGYDGQMALGMARTHRPDLIILDVSMPMTNGLRTLEFLRELSETRDTPVVFLTGHLPKELAPSLSGIHRVRCLTKPVEFDELIKVVGELITTYCAKP